jgi:hypothetical protein
MSNTLSNCNYTVDVPSFAAAKELHSMSWQSLVFYSYLLGYTIRKKTNGKWINIPSRIFQGLYGKQYRKHLDYLLQIKWIEENSKYKNAKNGFTKSFRISNQNYAKKHKKFTVLLQKRIYEKIYTNPNDKSDLSDEYTRLLKKRHDSLFISNARSVLSKQLKTKLDLKIANISIGEDKRAYSTIILYKKTARKDVTYGDRGSLVNVDVSAMIQQLLNWKIKDEKWDDWLRGDFASCLQKELKLKGNRDAVKRQFMTAISDGNKFATSLKILHFLKKEFPSIMHYVDILKEDTTIQMVTHKMEGKLIRSFIMEHQHLNVIPAHDGVFCGEMDAEAVQDALERFLKAKGLLGLTKITYYNPKSRPLTLEDIFSQIHELKC